MSGSLRHRLRRQERALGVMPDGFDALAAWRSVPVRECPDLVLVALALGLPSVPVEMPENVDALMAAVLARPAAQRERQA